MVMMTKGGYLLLQVKITKIQKNIFSLVIRKTINKIEKNLLKKSIE